MAISYHNIAGSSGLSQELIAPKSNVEEINSILVVNTHNTNSAEFTLFIQDDPESGEGLTTNTFNFIKKLSIPPQTSFILDDKKLLSFDNEIYGLYVTLASGDTLDILIA
tara:strand:+ start:337 stop:666 length:330 start_codon:yes stop_codon:yes gene_type:complete